MGGLSEHGAEEPTKKAVIFWGVATGAVAAIMLLAGGDQPAEALNGLQNITIVASLPFVLVMLLLCVALWKDLSRDPMMIRNQIARHVLEDSVAQGIDRHDGEPFELRTVEAVIDVKPLHRSHDATEQDGADEISAPADPSPQEPVDEGKDPSGN
ncbi:hypothetical protein GCM10009626_23860 [Brachybacterium sacelli]